MKRVYILWNQKHRNIIAVFKTLESAEELQESLMQLNYNPDVVIIEQTVRA